MQPSESFQLPVIAVFAITVNMSQGQHLIMVAFIFLKLLLYVVTFFRFRGKEIRGIARFVFRANIFKAVLLQMIVVIRELWNNYY